MGDVSGGHHDVNLVFSPPVRIWPDEKLVFTYSILNNSGTSPDMEKVQFAFNQIADFMGDAANTYTDSLNTLYKTWVPSAGSALSDALKSLISLAFASCDGTVALDSFNYTQHDFISLTANGSYPNQISYPGNLPRDSDAYKQLYESPSGCGPNSDYRVYWSLSRRAPPSVPELSWWFKPCAVVASRQLSSHYDFVAFMVDQYGWVWRRGHAIEQGWEGFVNLGAPSGTAASGSPCAAATPSGYLSAFVVGTNGHLFELRQDDEDSWSWVDHGNPPGEQAVPDAAVVSGAAGYTGVFVVSQQGKLWELPYANGWQDWKPHHAPPEGTDLADGVPAGAILSSSSPCVISNSYGTHVFVLASNSCFYHYLPGTSEWRNYGSPNTMLRGTPSFFASVTGYQGLVWGMYHRGGSGGELISHILELSCTDEQQHPVWSYLGPSGNLENRVYGSPALIPAARDSQMSAVARDLQGGVIELYRDNTGTWQAAHACDAPIVDNQPVATSDPVWIPQGWGALMTGSDGHLYQLLKPPNTHNWTFTDLSI